MFTPRAVTATAENACQMTPIKETVTSRPVSVTGMGTATRTAAGPPFSAHVAVSVSAAGAARVPVTVTRLTLTAHR